MFVAVASRTALSVTIHQDGCQHLNSRTSHDIVGRHQDTETLKTIALEVYDPEAAPLVKFRKGGCLNKN